MTLAQVARDQDASLDDDHDKRLAELLSSDEDPAANFDEIARLLGRDKR